MWLLIVSFAYFQSKVFSADLIDDVKNILLPTSEVYVCPAFEGIQHESDKCIPNWSLPKPEEGCCFKYWQSPHDQLNKIKLLDTCKKESESRLQKVDNQIKEMQLWNAIKPAAKGFALGAIALKLGKDANPLVGIVADTVIDVGFGLYDADNHIPSAFQLVNDLREEINEEITRLQECMDARITIAQTDLVVKHLSGVITFQALCAGFKTLEKQYDCINDLFETWHQQLELLTIKYDTVLGYENLLPMVKKVMNNFPIAVEAELERLMIEYYIGRATLDDYENVRQSALADMKIIEDWIDSAAEAIVKEWGVPKKWTDNMYAIPNCGYEFTGPEGDTLKSIYASDKWGNNHQLYWNAITYDEGFKQKLLKTDMRVFTSEHGQCGVTLDYESVSNIMLNDTCYSAHEYWTWKEKTWPCDGMRHIGARIIDNLNDGIKKDFKQNYFPTFEEWKQSFTEMTPGLVACNNPFKLDQECLKREIWKDDSLEHFSRDSMSFKWKRMYSCKEGKEKAFKMDDMYETLAKYAVVVWIRPWNYDESTPPDFEFDAEKKYQLFTKPCSNPVRALNHGKELSYKLNVKTGKFEGFADVNDWEGIEDAKERIKNTRDCVGPNVNIDVNEMSSWFYHATCNPLGIHIAQNKYCWWNWDNEFGHDISIFYGFLKSSVCDENGEVKHLEQIASCGATVADYRIPSSPQIIYKIVIRKDYKNVYAEPCGSSFDTYLFSYDEQMKKLQSNNDISKYGSTCDHSKHGDVGIPPTDGVVKAGTYYFGVGGWNSDVVEQDGKGSGGNYKLKFICEEIPPPWDSWNSVIGFVETKFVSAVGALKYGALFILIFVLWICCVFKGKCARQNATKQYEKVAITSNEEETDNEMSGNL
eukprot:555351_1